MAIDRARKVSPGSSRMDDFYYDNVPDLTRRPDLSSRLPVHDDYLTSQEHFIQHPSRAYHSHEDAALRRYIGSGVAFVSLVAENLLSHPFLVLRRQCQVNPMSQRYHMQPFTLLPTMYHLHQHQGLTTLWKGLGSVLLVRGMSLGVEDLVSKVTPWPKDINSHSSLKQFFQHTLLKCVSLAIVTPFYSASFVETVQSEIASEKPGILDVFKEGFMRLLHRGIPAKGRMLPIWAIIIPTVTLGLAKYLFSMMVRGATSRILNAKMKSMYDGDVTLNDVGHTTVGMQEVELTSSIVTAIISDIAFYPCETIVHRLHLQGTRTIVDNLDNGRSVLPILTNYAGAIDCYEHCLNTEGVCGLYKGLGALILQYAAHIALIQMSHFILTQIGTLLKKPEPKPQQQIDISPPAISSITSMRRSYLLP